MITQEMSTLITGATSAAGGAVTVGWIAKVLIQRYLRENDKKHELSATGMAMIANKLSDIALEIAVVKQVLTDVAAVKNQVSKDHDKLIALSTWNEKYREDLLAQFNKIRKIELAVEEVGTFISQIRRSQSNG